MNFRFRMDTRTLCVMAGAMLATLLLLDIQSLRQTRPRTASQALLSDTVQERVVAHELAVVDDSGQTRVRLGMNEFDAPALSLSDRTGHERALLRLNQDNVPSLRLFDDNGTLREGLGFARGPLTPHLWFYDANGGIQQMLPGSNVGRVNPWYDFADYNSNVDDTTIFRNDKAVSGSISDNIVVWSNKNAPCSLTVGIKGEPVPAGMQERVRGK